MPPKPTNKQSKKTKSRSQSKESEADRDKSGGYVANTITTQKPDEEMSDNNSDMELGDKIDDKKREELEKQAQELVATMS